MKTGTSVALHALVVAAGVFSCFRPTLLSGFERMQSDNGDTVLNNYLLEHTWLWLTDPGYPFSFWSPGFFHPTPDALTYSENMIGVAPVYWSLRTIFDETVAFQLWEMLLFVLNYASLVWVLQRWRAPWLWSAALGYVFAFGLARSAQIGHQHLHGQFFSVLAIHQFRRFVEGPSVACWLGLGICVAGQCLAGIYLGWFLCFGLASSAVFLALLNRNASKAALGCIRSNPLSFLLATALWSLPTAWFFSHYLHGNDAPREYAESCSFMPDFRNWFVGCAHSLWDCDLGIVEKSRIEEGRQSNGLMLYILYLLAGWSAIRMPAGEERTWVRCLLATWLFLMLSVLNLGNGFSIWWLAHNLIPGANALRAVGRMALMAHLFGLLAVGLSAKHYARIGFERRWQYAFIALMLAEQIVWHHDSFPKVETYATARSIAGQCRDWDLLFIEDPANEGSPQHEVLAMWAGLYARKPVVNGYSGRTPPGYFESGPPTDRELRYFARPGSSARFGRVRIVDSVVEIRKIP